MKKIICGLIMIFLLLGFVSAIYEYAGGYDEVPATVTKVYVARSSHKGPVTEKYNLEWTNKAGEIASEEAVRNKDGYSEGDMVTIKVDARNHDTIYGNYIPYMIVYLVLFAICGFVGFRKKNNEKEIKNV